MVANVCMKTKLATKGCVHGFVKIWQHLNKVGNLGCVLVLDLLKSSNIWAFVKSDNNGQTWQPVNVCWCWIR